MASSAAAVDALALPDGFPLAPKGCEKPAQRFFDCFTAAGAQQDGVADAAAGARGLAACASQLAAYRKCLAWHERARPQPGTYRVPEAYRPGGDAYGVHEGR